MADDANLPLGAADPSGGGFQDAMTFLEANLEGENWFLERVRDVLSKKDDLSGYPAISSRLGHNNLIQLVQFLFVLEALDCTQPANIKAFVDAHNEKIQADLDAGKSHVSPRELKKAMFTPHRRDQLAFTFEHFKRPVFSVYELGHLLIDLMSPKTTENIVTDLLYGGLFRQRGGPGEDAPLKTDESRVLVEPTEFLIDTYRTSLLRSRARLLQG